MSMDRSLAAVEHDLVIPLLRGDRALLFAPSLDGIPQWYGEGMPQVTIAVPDSRIAAYREKYPDNKFWEGEGLYLETAPYDTVFVHYDQAPKACADDALELGQKGTQFIFLVHREFADPLDSGFPSSLLEQSLAYRSIHITEITILPEDMEYTLLVARKTMQRPRSVLLHRADFSDKVGFFVLPEPESSEEEEGTKISRSATLKYCYCSASDHGCDCHYLSCRPDRRARGKCFCEDGRIHGRTASGQAQDGTDPGPDEDQ